MNRPSIVHLKVWGDYACITRPELKAERVSYPMLTPSAARGVLEAIFYEPQMYYIVHEIAVLNPVRWVSFRRNEVKKVVSGKEAARAAAGLAVLEPIHSGAGSENCTQRGTLALVDVAYLITAEIQLSLRAQPPRDTLTKYHDLFQGRAAKGKCFHRPYLGCREFAADFEPAKPNDFTRLDPTTFPDQDLGVMLYDVFPPGLRPAGDSVPAAPVFFHARVRGSRLDCHPDRVHFLNQRP